jgi:hypothetical protein
VDLDQVIRAQTPKLEEFRHLVMAYASFRSDDDRATRKRMLSELAALPEFRGEPYQKHRRVAQDDLKDESSGDPAGFTNSPDLLLDNSRASLCFFKVVSEKFF